MGERSFLCLLGEVYPNWHREWIDAVICDRLQINPLWDKLYEFRPCKRKWHKNVTERTYFKIHDLLWSFNFIISLTGYRRFRCSLDNPDTLIPSDVKILLAQTVQNYVPTFLHEIQKWWAARTYWIQTRIKTQDELEHTLLSAALQPLFLWIYYYRIVDYSCFCHIRVSELTTNSYFRGAEATWTVMCVDAWWRGERFIKWVACVLRTEDREENLWFSD